MAFDFPAGPVPGQIYTSGAASYTWDGVAWMSGGSSTAGGGDYVLKAGDTMTGFLTLNADPIQALHAATMADVDSVALPPVGADGEALVARTGAAVWGAAIQGGNF
jgi:hypothetical protein